MREQLFLSCCGGVGIVHYCKW